MKNKFKRFLSVALSVAMLISVMVIAPVKASSEEYGYVTKSYTFDESDAVTPFWKWINGEGVLDSGTIVQDPENSANKVLKFDTTDVTPYLDLYGKDVISVEFDIYAEEWTNGKTNNNVTIISSGSSAPALAYINSGYLRRSDTYSNVYAMEGGKWYTIRLIYDYETQKVTYYAALKDAEISKIADVQLLNSAVGNDRNIKQIRLGTPNTNDVYFDNFKVYSYPDCYSAINSCTTTEEVKEKTELYTSLGLFTKHADISRVESEEEVYNALLNKSFTSTQQLQNAYNEAVVSGNTGIRVTDSSYNSETSSVEFVNTTEDVESYRVYHLAFTENDGVKTLIESNIESLEDVEENGSAVSSYIFTQLSEYENIIVKTIVAKSDNTPIKSIVYGDETELQTEGSGDVLTVNDFSLDTTTGVLTAKLTGGKSRELIYVNAMSGKYIDAVKADENGNVKLQFTAGTIADGIYDIEALGASGTDASKESVFNTSDEKPAVTVEVSGIGAVGYELTASYKYFQIGGIEEKDNSVQYKWYCSESENGAKSVIPDADTNKFTPLGTYGGKYIFAAVTVTSENDVVSEEAFSDAIAILSAPVASNVSVFGAPVEGNTVTASYTYHHMTNPEVNSSLRWIEIDESGNEISVLGTGIAYEIKNEDIGKKIVFEVIPKTNVVPETGGAVRSDAMVITAQTAETTKPVAENVEIKASDTENKLSASYEYMHQFTQNGESIIEWFVSDTEAGEYTLLEKSELISYSDDIKNKYLKLAVTPVSEKEIVGDKVYSAVFKVYELPSVENLEIKGTTGNRKSVAAMYDFSQDEENDESSIEWLIEGVKVSEDNLYTLPDDSAGKTLTLNIIPKSKLFPKFGEAQQINATVETIIYAEPFEGNYVTSTQIIPSNKYFVSAEALIAEKQLGAENSYISTVPGTNIWIKGDGSGGNICIDIRAFLESREGKTTADAEAIRFKDDNNNAWFSIIKIGCDGTVDGTSAKIEDNRWFNLRVVVDNEADTAKIYLGPDKNNMELIKENVEINIADNAVVTTYEITKQGNGAHTLNIGEMTVSCLPVLYSNIKEAADTEEIINIFDCHSKLGFFNYPADFEKIDDEQLVLKKIFSKKDNYTSSEDISAYLMELTELHNIGARVTGCRLYNGEDTDISDAVVKGYTGVKTKTNIKSTSGTSDNFAVITAVYEKSINGDKILYDYSVKNENVTETGIESVSDVITVNSEKEYTVRVFVWNTLELPSKMLSVRAFNDFTEITDVNGNSATSSITDSIAVTAESGNIVITGNCPGGDGQYLQILVKNPSGNIVYMDEIYTCGDNGSFKLPLTLASPAESGAYTVSFKLGKNGSSKTDTFILESDTVAPSVNSLKITGDTYYGQTVRVEYEYFQLAGINQGNTEFSWYIADSEEGVYTPIEGKTQQTLLLDKSYSGKYIKASVSPVTETGTQGATAYSSNTIRVVMIPEVRDVKITGTAKVGNTVSVAYKFVEPLYGYKESGTEYAWYRGNTVVGTSQSYEISGSDAGFALKCVVTPKMAQYPYTGISVETKSVTVASSGSGGGSGGGGSSNLSASPVISAGNEKVDYATGENTGRGVFADTANHWAKDTIDRLYSQGIINGINSTHYDPDGYVTRAEFAAIINRILGVDADNSVMPFADIEKNAWYYADICKIYSLGIMQGENGEFRPNDRITRQEMALVARRVYTYKYDTVPSAEENSGFNDYKNISPWAYDAVMYCSHAGIIKGDTNGFFNPLADMTRAEAAVVTERIMSLK